MFYNAGLGLGGAAREHGFPSLDVRLGELFHDDGGAREGVVDDNLELGMHARKLVLHAFSDLVIFFLRIVQRGFGDTDVSLQLFHSHGRR